MPDHAVSEPRDLDAIRRSNVTVLEQPGLNIGFSRTTREEAV
jgi:hypothetical protein